MTTINIGIVAHVDSGKTSLTERILYETHVIDEIGRVDKGTTQTDSLDLEKRRGITIKASVVSFFVNNLKINLIDTPGHADFLAEVERSLSVLDGAVLLISAVEGIQAQTRILLSILRKLRIPTIIFINKIDRSGAQADELLKRVKEKLTEHIIPLYRPRTHWDKAGVKELLAELGRYFPSHTSLEGASLSGVVFKLEKEATGEKIAYVRVFAGSVRVRTSLNLRRRKHNGESEIFTGKIQKLHMFCAGKTVQAQQVGAGEFCKVWGLKEVKIGDVVGEWSEHIKTLHFATPRYETRIEAAHREQDHRLYQVLLELAEQDPLIYVLKDNVHQATYLRIFGEVQKEYPRRPAAALPPGD